MTTPKKLTDKRIAILVDHGFEESEMTEPRKALEAAGAEVHLVSPAEGNVKSWTKGDWGKPFPVDKPLGDTSPGDYHALVLPGGVMNPDRLRRNETAVRFTRAFFEQKKPVAAICHGPWTLIDADVVKGRKMTSYESLRTDLRNAGAEWTDEAVVVDDGLVTSRTPEDLPAFCDKVVEEIAEGKHSGQSA